jgi:hypothetical protein
MADVGEMEFSEMKDDQVPLAYPSMRAELLEHLRELANVELQKTEWTAGSGRFDLVVHFLFDDTPAPRDALGYYLATEAEREAVLDVASAIDVVLARLGTERSDPDYVGSAEWMDVVDAAQRALRVLEALP